MEKLKNILKSKQFRIGTASVILAAAITVCGVLIVNNGRKEKPTDETEPPASSQVKVDDIADPTVSDITEPTVTDGEPDTTEFDKMIEELKNKNTEPTKPKEPAKKPQTPVTEKTAEPTEPDKPVSGIIIGGNEPQPPYNCGAKNHHCDGPETHAYIQNLELEGCEYCGSHSCPSFYATNEWGFARYTPSKCPKYTDKSNPAEYCQTCGKKSADGKNDTCIRFIEACECPSCGAHVEGRTCHTCK